MIKPLEYFKKIGIEKDKIIKKKDYFLIKSNNINYYLIYNRNIRLEEELNNIYNYPKNIIYTDKDIEILIGNNSYETDDEKYDELLKFLINFHNNTTINNLSKEELDKKLEELEKLINKNIEYYLDLQDYIERFAFPRLDYYELIISISRIYKIFSLANIYLNKIKDLESDVRKSFIINDITIDNFDGSFINLNLLNKDIMIYDFVSFYKEEYENKNIKKFFNTYKNGINLSLKEEYLFKLLICIPKRIEESDNLYQNSVDIYHLINYIDNTLEFLEQNQEKQETDK